MHITRIDLPDEAERAEADAYSARLARWNDELDDEFDAKCQRNDWNRKFDA